MDGWHLYPKTRMMSPHGGAQTEGELLNLEPPLLAWSWSRASKNEVPNPSWASVLQKKAGPDAVFMAPSCFSGDISLTTATTNQRVLAPTCYLPGPPPPSLIPPRSWNKPE